MDDSLEVMGGVCQNPSKQWVLYRLPVGKTTYKRIITEDNPRGDLTINNIEIASSFAHLYIFNQLMDPLEHISTNANKTVVEVWTKRGSVSSDTDAGLLQR